MARSVLFLLILDACAARVSDPLLHLHPPAHRSISRPEVVERSAPPPDWIEGPAPGRLLAVGIARDLSTARAQARAELSQSLARLVGVRIATEFEVSEGEKNGSASFAAHEETRLEADRLSVEPDREYWERMSDGSWRCFLAAPYDEATILRLKRTKRMERALAGRKLVVIHFSGPNARAVEREVVRRLGALEGLLAMPAREATDLEAAHRIEGTIEELRASLSIDGVRRAIQTLDPLELEPRIAKAIEEELKHAR